MSQVVTQDYCEALQKLELEQDLRLHAEAFAHKVRAGWRGAPRGAEGGGRCPMGHWSADTWCTAGFTPNPRGSGGSPVPIAAPVDAAPQGTVWFSGFLAAARRGAERQPPPLPDPRPLGQMLVAKKEASRQSSILLQSAGPSAQLLRALQEVGSLTRALEEARQQHQQQVRAAGYGTGWLQTSASLAAHRLPSPRVGFPPWISTATLWKPGEGSRGWAGAWWDPPCPAPRVSARR